MRDLISLTKPRLTSLVLITAAGAAWLAHRASRPSSALRLCTALLATTLAVCAANTLNCYLERDLDRLMVRTRQRPLPSGRMNPRTALAFGVCLSLVSVPMLWLGVNPVTGALGALAIALYVLVYTPMKTRSSAALLLGAIPGALPPLIGWTAVTGRVSTVGLCLFAVLFFWQIPHFLAIAIYRHDEYAAAGVKVMTLSRPFSTIRWQILGWTLGLVPVTLTLTLLGVAGRVYFASALALGGVFVGLALRGPALHGSALRGSATNQHIRWARKLFLYSLVYLSGIFIALALNAQ